MNESAHKLTADAAIEDVIKECIRMVRVAVLTAKVKEPRLFPFGTCSKCLPEGFQSTGSVPALARHGLQTSTGVEQVLGACVVEVQGTIRVGPAGMVWGRA
jgi:hypothetical protein